LQIQELPEFVDLYRTATIRALAAGFDGVEVLAAGGYLLSGILAEHWDVIQNEATEADSKSGKPMFGNSFPAPTAK